MAPAAVIPNLADDTDQCAATYKTPNTSRLDSTSRPSRIESSLAWNAHDFEASGARSRPVYEMTEKEKLDVQAALEYFKSLKIDGSEINRHNFPLPSFQERLRAFSAELHDGKGFVIVRGLNPRKYTTEDSILVFLGISSHLAELRGKQDHNGNVMMHICDAKQMPIAQADRPARDSNVALTFHTDLWANILALQTLGCAAVGGDHVISPAYTVYNHLAATRPKVLDTLMAPNWTFDPHSLHCEVAPKRPLMYWHDGRILFNFGRLHVEGAQSSNLSMSPEQVEALQVLQDAAKEHQLKLPLLPGDLCYINNLAFVHAREAFQDSETEVRHLVRLWLKDRSRAWKLPPTLEAGNWKVYHDRSTEEKWDIVPPPRVNFDVRDAFSP